MRVGDLPFLADLGAILVVSVAIVLRSDDLATMTAVVVGAAAGRAVLFALTPRAGRDTSIGLDLAFFAAATVLGAFNDWMSVTVRGVYAYRVPTDLAWSDLPAWMLLYWGLILHFVATLFRWRRLGLPPPRDDLSLGRRVLGGAGARVAAMLALVLATRQAIYRTWSDPVASWLPFAAALALGLLLLRPDRRRLALLGVFAVGGPAVESLYIRAGHLHEYAHGILGGVPVWIALWWVLAAWFWSELSERALRALSSRRQPVV